MNNYVIRILNFPKKYYLFYYLNINLKNDKTLIKILISSSYKIKSIFKIIIFLINLNLIFIIKSKKNIKFSFILKLNEEILIFFKSI